MGHRFESCRGNKYGDCSSEEERLFVKQGAGISKLLIHPNFDSVAQLVELPAFNRKVVGSSPTGVTNGESSSGVERLIILW